MWFDFAFVIATRLLLIVKVVSLFRKMSRAAASSGNADRGLESGTDNTVTHEKTSGGAPAVVSVVTDKKLTVGGSQTIGEILVPLVGNTASSSSVAGSGKKDVFARNFVVANRTEEMEPDTGDSDANMALKLEDPAK